MKFADAAASRPMRALWDSSWSSSLSGHTSDYSKFALRTEPEAIRGKVVLDAGCGALYDSKTPEAVDRSRKVR